MLTLASTSCSIFLLLKNNYKIQYSPPWLGRACDLSGSVRRRKCDLANHVAEARRSIKKMGRTGGRVRLKSLKGKRWQKGQSSSSNPQSHMHRKAARGKFSSHLAQRTSQEEQGVALTTDALASHDAIQGEKDDIQLNNYR